MRPHNGVALVIPLCHPERVAHPIRPVPPREDLRRLAEAALSNAAELLADARLLAEAGRFPRAHALATLACEELGKEQQCLVAMHSLFAESKFWPGFTNHRGKLAHAQTFSVLHSGEPVNSVNLFNERVRQGSRSANERKFRGLYVDYVDGALQLPDEITDHETWQLIDQAQAVLDHSRSSWAVRVRQAELLSQLPTAYRLIWLLFIKWVVDTYPDLLIAGLREHRSDGVLGNMLGSLLPQFEQHVVSAGGWVDFIHAVIGEDDCDMCPRA